MKIAYVPAKEYRRPRLVDVAKQTARFQYYQEGNLWYRIEWQTETTLAIEINEFDFPVSVHDDAAGGRFEPEMKAITLQRWIRKHIEFLEQAERLFAAANKLPVVDACTCTNGCKRPDCPNL